MAGNPDRSWIHVRGRCIIDVNGSTEKESMCGKRAFYGKHDEVVDVEDRTLQDIVVVYTTVPSDRITRRHRIRVPNHTVLGK
jgi:hypothetical protein